MALYLLQIWGKLTVKNPNIDHGNINVRTKFGRIMSICSQDIEIMTSLTRSNIVIQICEKCRLAILIRFCQYKGVYMNKIHSKDIEATRNSDIYHGP